MDTKNPTKHTGTCHCGAIKFEVMIDATAGTRCNCTICTKVAYLGASVKPEAFTLLAGEDQLGSYLWGGKVATRYFCKTCGVHCFGKGHLDILGGDFLSVNFNCLDDIDVGTVEVGYWDGRHNNWQAGMRDTPWPIFSAA
jgi:hypothetical protein